MNQTIDSHQDRGAADTIFEVVDPVSVVVGLLHTHCQSVARGLHKSRRPYCDAEK